MTLAGTRPILPDELEQYELHHRARIAIKPGITGMWQVSGRSDITDFEEIVRLDTEWDVYAVYPHGCLCIGLSGRGYSGIHSSAVKFYNVTKLRSVGLSAPRFFIIAKKYQN